MIVSLHGSTNCIVLDPLTLYVALDAVFAVVTSGYQLGVSTLYITLYLVITSLYAESLGPLKLPNLFRGTMHGTTRVSLFVF